MIYKNLRAIRRSDRSGRLSRDDITSDERRLDVRTAAQFGPDLGPCPR